MHRTFLSLYLLIVASVLMLGWATEQIWQRYADEEAPKQELFTVLSSLVVDQKISELELNRLAEKFDARTQLFELQELSSTSIAERIAEGELVTVADELSVSYYQKLEGSDTVLSLSYSRDNQNRQWLYRLLIIGFYCSLAMVVYFWVWPLIRDLKKLQKHAQDFAEGVSEVTPLSLAPSSGVYELALTFNSMASEIETLLSSQRDMSHAISHELRTPLARMKFALEALSLSSDEKELAALKQDVLEMDRLIREFLTYAKFDHRKQRLEWNDGRLDDLLHSIVQGLELTIGKKIDLNCQPHTVSCDWVLMERCLANLIENAAKYCREQVRISVQWDGDQCRVIIEDDGEGVPEQERAKIFDAFYRSESATQRARGFGVGLALVKRIAILHKGTVSVSKSQLGGAQFEFSWPSAGLND